MKKYVAIGHFAWSDNITSVCCTQNSKKDFMRDLVGNEFRGWCILSEKQVLEIAEMTSYLDIFKAVRKYAGQSQWRKWNDVADYLYYCMDIVIKKLNRAI